MSNPTTPFSWQMPTATDLVTDLPADFEVFGQAVATSMADLLGGTSGQILAKNSNTDMDFVWIANDQGDITGVTAGTGISGGGTSGTVTITNSMATAITTAGDTLYGTGSGTFSRLGIGTAGQVLQVNSGATAPEWATSAAGGMTLLSTTTLTGASTTISSISGSYTNLLILIYGVTNNTANGNFSLTFNALGNNNNYYVTQYNNNGTTATRNANNDAIFFNLAADQYSRTSANNYIALSVSNYASATTYKGLSLNGYYVGNSFNEGLIGGGGLNVTAAITQIVLSNSGGTFSAGTCLIYGVK